MTRVVGQSEWLERLGIGARAAALAKAHPERAEEIAAERMRLCDADAMGQLFKVIGFAHPKLGALPAF